MATDTTRCLQISEEEWSEADAVAKYLTAHLKPGEVLEMGVVENALSSRATIRTALRWRVVRLEGELRAALAQIPKPPPPPPPRPKLVRNDASRVAPVLAFDPSRSSPHAVATKALTPFSGVPQDDSQ